MISTGECYRMGILGYVPGGVVLQLLWAAFSGRLTTNSTACWHITSKYIKSPAEQHTLNSIIDCQVFGGGLLGPLVLLSTLEKMASKGWFLCWGLQPLRSLTSTPNTIDHNFCLLMSHNSSLANLFFQRIYPTFYLAPHYHPFPTKTGTSSLWCLIFQHWHQCHLVFYLVISSHKYFDLQASSSQCLGKLYFPSLPFLLYCEQTLVIFVFFVLLFQTL